MQKTTFIENAIELYANEAVNWLNHYLSDKENIAIDEEKAFEFAFEYIKQNGMDEIVDFYENFDGEDEDIIDEFQDYLIMNRHREGFYYVWFGSEDESETLKSYDFVKIDFDKLKEQVLDKMYEDLDIFECFGKKDEYDIDVDEESIKNWLKADLDELNLDNFILADFETFDFRYHSNKKGWNDRHNIFYIESESDTDNSVWIDYFGLKKQEKTK